MPRFEDLSNRCLAVVASEQRWREVLLPALRTASLPDGRSLEPERVDPRRAADLSADRTLDLLELASAVFVDLADVPAAAFPLFAWHARARPRSVVLLRAGNIALPFELSMFPVRSIDTEPPVVALASRRLLAELATMAAHARARAGAAQSAVATTRGNLARRARREKNGAAAALRRASRAVLAGDPASALEALGAALIAERDAPDILLRAAILHRDAGRWPEAAALLSQAVASDDGCAPAWRELGIARDRDGEPDAEPALRRAIELEDDYAAMVSLALIARRRGAIAEAIGLLERAIGASEGQLNLVLPLFVLRASREGRVVLTEDDQDRVRDVLAIRGAQAEGSAPEDAPWSHFDAAQAHLLLGDDASALQVVSAAKEHVHAPWETEVFAAALDSLERAGATVAPLRAALSISERRVERTAAAKRAPGRPFRAAARVPEWYRENVPCAAACPVGTDAGAYVALAAKREFAEAYRVARGPNPFASVCGRICAAPCEDACRRGKLDAPVGIRAIKRFLTERHGVESGDSRIADVLDGSAPSCLEGEAYASHLKKLGAGTTSGRRVAVVGGGPAGLACAHDLAFLGHRVTLFESTGTLGGMMRLGIPEYRLPRDVLDAEIETVLSLGVEVRLNEGLDAKHTLRSLFDEGYEAAFLASGASRGRDMDVEGGALDGVVRAIDFLINVNSGFRMELGRRVVVVGGGAVAIDVARTARLGRAPSPRASPESREATRAMAPALAGDALRAAVAGESHEVHIVARQSLGTWPAQKSVHGREEVEEARREGITLHGLRGVRRVLGEGGRVQGVELIEISQAGDGRGRSTPVYGSQAAETIACDAVVLAIGQEPDLDYLDATSDLRRTANGLIEVDPKTLTTSLPGVFAGGDAAFGPRTLIEAVAEGKRAARGIHAHLAGGAHGGEAPTLPMRITFEEVLPRSVPAAPDYDSIPRLEPGCIAVARRTGLSEVEGSYDEEEAVRQAQRCLRCHVQTVYDGSLCIACGRCTDICPHRCLSLVPPEDADLVGWNAGAAAAAQESALMIKDETLCVRCGLCAERCPTGAMTMEEFRLEALAAGTGVAGAGP